MESEAAIEARMVRMVRNRGGLCYKFISPGNPGVPDRLVVTPDGRSIFVELKTDIGRLSKLQKWQRQELERRGVEVRVLYGWEQIRNFIEEVLPNELQTV